MEAIETDSSSTHAIRNIDDLALDCKVDRAEARKALDRVGKNEDKGRERIWW